MNHIKKNKPLEAPYTGPYKLTKSSGIKKHFLEMNNNIYNYISVNRETPYVETKNKSN